MDVVAYALTISEQDFISAKKRVDQAYLYAMLMFLLFALFAFLNTYNKNRKKTGKERDVSKPLLENDIKKLIGKGESEYIEFKSSLRWDYREGRVNTKLEEVILKSIAAFANAKGGTLFIGVNDAGEIIGLGPDFNTLKKQDADYFELHLRRMINNQYGIRFSNQNIVMQFSEIDKKIICIVRILQATSALFMKTKNKQGKEVEKFYVRSGNASHEIASLTELHDYLQEHFKSKN
jgi:predicted HTH transcriptional regulator